MSRSFFSFAWRAQQAVKNTHFCIEKERKKDEEQNERGRDRERRLRAANLKSLFFEILSDLSQVVPYHLADESQTR